MSSFREEELVTNLQMTFIPKTKKKKILYTLMIFTLTSKYFFNNF